MSLLAAHGADTHSAIRGLPHSSPDRSMLTCAEWVDVWCFAVGIGHRRLALGSAGLIRQHHRQCPAVCFEPVACSLRIMLPMAAAWFVTFVAMGGSKHPSVLLRALRVGLRCQTFDG